MDLSSQILDFYKELDAPSFLPSGVEVMDPYHSDEVQEYLRSFYTKFYNDLHPRIMLVGINPGRFGGGLTGIPFTDPVNLQEVCGVPNELDKRHELSSKFIYEMIASLGGVEKFYQKIYITAASPLGFVMSGRNLNYYDIPELAERWKPFISKTLKLQSEFCQNRTICYSLGQGKNFKFLLKLNEEFQIFEKIESLPHPRWIMQYRLKRKDEFISMYEEALKPFLD